LTGAATCGGAEGFNSAAVGAGTAGSVTALLSAGNSVAKVWLERAHAPLCGASTIEDASMTSCSGDTWAAILVRDASFAQLALPD
jgi:hypothetical protein